MRAAEALPVPLAHDHAALALLPFTVASHDQTASTEPITLAYQVEVDGKLQRTSVTLDPGRSTPLPTHGDQLVFLALLQLSLRDATPHDVLSFRRREVFDLLGWGTRGDYYDRFRQALQRLTALTITLQSELVSRNGRPYSRQDEAAHVIDRFRINRGHDADCSVAWGHLVREGFRLGDFKRLDWELLLALGNPLTMQLYRLLDRVTLGGHQRWEVGWKPLASALGMRAEAYSRPARFRQVLDPHLKTLAEQGVVDSVDYLRGGRFVFHVRNYLRAKLREVLTERFGVYPDAARQLVAGYDETTIMAQADCLQHGARPRPESPGGYLVKAVQESFELRYSDDEPEAFAALWGMLSAAEREGHHEAALLLCGAGDDLFATNPDPTAWPTEFRAVARFMVAHGFDPAEVLRTPATLRALRGA